MIILIRILIEITIIIIIIIIIIVLRLVWEVQNCSLFCVFRRILRSPLLRQFDDLLHLALTKSCKLLLTV